MTVRAPAARTLGVRLLAAAVAGLGVGLSFPPVDLGPLVLVALVPLLWAWRDARPRDAALTGFVFGAVAYTIDLPWMRYFGAVAIAPLVAVLALGTAGVGLLVSAWARRGVSSPLLTAAAWTFAEALLGRWPLGGFPWVEVGVSLHDVPAARAVASVGGVLLVTFLVVALNGFVLDLVVAVVDRDPRRRARSLAAAGVAGVLVVTAVADLTWFQPHVTGHLRIAVLQGDDRELSLDAQNRQLLTDAHLTLADRLRGHYDLVVFPESALDTDPQLDPILRSELTALGARLGADLLVNARTPGTHGLYRNSNLLLTSAGRVEGVYSKQHLVPFGEYVPWRSDLSFIGELRQIPYDFQPGDRRVLFHAGGHPLGSVICFESAFGPLVRDYVRDGAQLMVVTTSNRSYRRSGNAAQHLALGQFRAAETGRALVQASVSGISGIVGPKGDVHDTTDLFRRAVVTATVPTTTGETLYVRVGDWIVVLSALLVLGATVVAVRRPVTSGV